MTNPITPPPELVQQWASEWMQLQNVNRDNFMATRAAQWGADAELEACCEWLAIHFAGIEKILRATRRPKSLSLKQQALNDLNAAYDASKIEVATYCNIRRALEQLDD